MKKGLFCLILSLIAIVSFGQVRVKGYTKSNGTYVQPYTRSSPDGNPYNNYSYPGNTNPYTGKVATGNPDTYLNNYYNRSSSNSSNFTDSKVYLKSNNSVNKNKGRYLKSFYKSENYTIYDIYNNENIYDGYLTYFNNGTIRIYDKNRNFIKEATTSTVDNYYNFDFNNINTNSSASSQIPVPPHVLHKDKFFREGDYVTKIVSANDLDTIYNHYDSNGKYLGFYSISSNGEVFG